MGSRSEVGSGQEGSSADESGLIIEFHRVGNVVKVTAVDPVSLVEVSIVGDPSLGEAALSRAAARKLRYVLEKRDAPAKGDGRSRTGGDGRGGTLV